MSNRQLEKARIEAAAARERLLGSVHAVQERLRPSTIANDVWDEVRDRGEAAVEKATQVATERPVATSAAALGVAAFVLRRPIARLFRRRKPKRNDVAGADAGSREHGR